MARPVQLQINQSGAWRSGLDFNEQALGLAVAKHHLDQFLRLAYGPTTTARIVVTRMGDRGKVVSTHEVILRWTSEKGWAPA